MSRCYACSQENCANRKCSCSCHGERKSGNLHLIVAMDQTGCIGRANALPWKIPEDMKHFKALTMGHAVIMGRKTFEWLENLCSRTSRKK